ncbi:MAG: ABC transporter substrate-binding protein, partial [Treponema sp.]|nr:ABC transporter substrate-binding protein [Treponema sp.]
MKLPDRRTQILTLTLFLTVFTLPLWLNSCKTVPAESESESGALIPHPGAEEPLPSPMEENPLPEKAPDYAEPRPRSEVTDEIVAVFSKGDLELDFRKSYIASEAQLFTAIYEGLFSYHPMTMGPVPAAASRWEISQDKKQWTFFIRENARFQNGDPVRAQDFRAAWLSLLAPALDAPYSSLFDIIEGAREFRLGRSTADKVGITATGEKTLVVRLNSPAAFFPSMLCHHSFSPIHPSMLNNRSWEKPVSNGPFYIDKIDEDHILLLKNPNYWDARRV